MLTITVIASASAVVEALNAAYRQKFGFPFVMAVRKSDKAAILAAFEGRLRNDPSEKLVRSLKEIKTIGGLRRAAIASA